MASETGIAESLPAVDLAGREIWELAARLYPICRSITGPGVRETLGVLGEYVPIAFNEVASGTPVLDWVVPPEWTIRQAYIADTRGRRIVDLANHTLHVVSYSTPVRARMSLAELRPHLHSLPDRPDLIPYRTAYYRPDWGFCLAHRTLEEMTDETYEVVIDATLSAGSLTYGEAVIPGESDNAILLTAHICHPSLANDNCSGLALLAWLGRHLATARRRYTYRLLFAPGTIGSITWLARNLDTVGSIAHGLVLSNLGDGGGPTYKRSRRGRAPVDRAAAVVLRPFNSEAQLLDFSPYGYDERQFCSPGFNMPMGALSRSRWGQFAAYHTSADNLDFIRPEHLDLSARIVAGILDVLEGDRTLKSTMPYGEPQLGQRGLYDDERGRPLPEGIRMALLWVLNLADGEHSLLDMCERSGLDFPAIQRAAWRLEAAGLLEEQPVQPNG